MAKLKFELNRAGVRDILRGSAMRGIVESHAGEMQSRAGEGYTVRYGRNRVLAFVETGSSEAFQDNYENNTVLKALSSSGYPRHK